MTAKRIEFRIPISPTAGFYSQVRFFNYALRRLGPDYINAKLTVVVGDRCDIDAVREQNRWSENFNVEWYRVPDEIAEEFGMWGTANWRLELPPGDADVIVLSDADTVLLGDIDPLISEIRPAEPELYGHMAHFPPPASGPGTPSGSSPDFWPWLFTQFGIAWPRETYRYSMDAAGALPSAPPYFNLGFVALSATAMPIIAAAIIGTERRVKALTQSHMRCQIALTLIAHQSGMRIGLLPAAYNAANDLGHLSANDLSIDDIRVLHYLRQDEIDRSTVFAPAHIDDFLARELVNPANRALQALARGYRGAP